MSDLPASPINNRVYYLGRDASLRKDLTRRLAEHRLQISYFDRSAELAYAAHHAPPAVLILDLGLVPKDTTVAGFLAEMLGAPEVPPALICTVETEGIGYRLQAVRAGAKGFFLAPIEPAELAARVVTLHRGDRSIPYRILIVEDEQSQAMYVALLLSNAGMKVRSVNDPLKVLEVMNEFRPDLILMDVYMPGASGAELTAIIREHDSFFDTPILMVSQETDPDKQFDALLVGGDAFLTKPVHQNHLIAAIEHRIRMSRAQQERRAFIARRSARTGVIDKDHFMRILEQTLHDESAQEPGTGLILLEIDSPQQILDQLGLSGAEKLLTHLERLFARHLNSTDSVARFGDVTYGVLARRRDRTTLVDTGKVLCRLIAEPKDALGLPQALVTASVGIGFFLPPPQDALAMVGRATQACARARQNGGNRVELWAAQEERSEDAVQGLIERGLAGDGFVLLYQPIIPLGQGVTVHYEAQLRLRAPDGELMAPGEFLPVAQHTGLMTAIDRWVMEYALDTLHDHSVRHPGLRIMVHQTMETVRRPDWLPWFREQLMRRRLARARTRPLLEFQMRDLHGSPEVARVLFGVLQKAGVHICVANVTHSASEIDLIGRLGVSLVKLSFHTLAHSAIGDLTNLVHHLHDRGVLTIAAGIEDQETVTRVWSCRADFIQGNYIQMAREDVSFENYDFRES
jgi:diguanylate cyclase (GGDEF)-like protein